jgi:hypothetical protein
MKAFFSQITGEGTLKKKKKKKEAKRPIDPNFFLAMLP